MDKQLLLNYGQVPLTGVYMLGEDYLFQKTAATDSDNRDPVTGSIQFPRVDLSVLLTEEATQSHQDLFWNKKQTVAEHSFLTYPSAFKSVIADNSGGIYPFQHTDHALLTRCGYKMGKIPNQDRSFIVNFLLDVNEGKFLNLDANENKSKGNGAFDPLFQKALLMGIFDGHGGRGHEVSHYIALEFPKVFTKTMRQKQHTLPLPLLDCIRNSKMGHHVENYMKEALKETFLEVDAHEPVKGTGGSTASVLFYPGIESKVYIANAGDSATIIAAFSNSRKESTIVYQNRKHKPHLEDERQRIENAGGQVMIPPSLLRGDTNSPGLKDTSRLIIPSANGFGSMALAMSRSIGDFDGKAVGLIAEPDVDVWDVRQHYQAHQFDRKQELDTQWFAVIASDGVYDMLAPEKVVEYLGRSLFDGHSSGTIISPLEACERLIREASRLWKKESSLSMGGMQYRDDITLGVSKIDFPSM
eukprot:CAMPEP_0172325160 /NCGR_PEP_ID=MMETSP1058-20130122/53275_1 /TAXON_ID=83371 /ORGANISM="Detonula confervacea, Strain CCMP 353" /LENGTH=470 /DNA_ID=CAMNT_0013041631 /DNA_START=276 /DNA_END=1688 /DNA_ORIENTATION=+